MKHKKWLNELKLKTTEPSRIEKGYSATVFKLIRQLNYHCYL